jgi:hypothetical protein
MVGFAVFPTYRTLAVPTDAAPDTNANSIVERLCFLPIECERGNVSPIALVEESGYLTTPEVLTRERILDILRFRPHLLDVWEGWFDDQRSTPALIFRTTKQGYSVTCYPEGEGMIFSDRFEACAEFILRQIHRTAEFALEYRPRKSKGRDRRR